MRPAGFEPAISAGERLQTYALDRAATGTGKFPSAFALVRAWRQGYSNAARNKQQTEA